MRHPKKTFATISAQSGPADRRIECPFLGQERTCPTECFYEYTRNLVASGGTNFSPVGCACRPGEERTRSCNYRPLCGSLKIAGQDVGQILISQGLAHPYVCGTDAFGARDFNRLFLLPIKVGPNRRACAATTFSQSDGEPSLEQRSFPSAPCRFCAPPR